MRTEKHNNGYFDTLKNLNYLNSWVESHICENSGNFDTKIFMCALIKLVNNNL